MNHYASSTSGSNSFGSRGAGLSLSPLSAIENLETPPIRSPQIYGTPMKVDEEVIVMDGILISSIHGEAKTVRSPLDSGSGGGGKNQYRSDICRYWEDSGTCRFGNKCQFAHGKEDLRPGRLPVRTKTKFSETYGSKFRNNHSLTGIAATTTTQSNSNLVDTITKTELSKRGLTPTSSTLKGHTNNNPTLISTISIINWSPEDDGIKIAVPGTESTKREDVNQHIHEVLYGSTTERTKKRLPVFVQICSEELQEE
uniref:C3H1-type domain-containing protein n=2 Tax=Cucumis sativus TaxID=3659 RepID=A0A0A0K529_CUCSA